MRELTLNEIENVNGAYSAKEFAAAVFTGGVTGALAGTLIGGGGAVPGAFAGSVIGGIAYLTHEIIMEFS
ncbi:hypothetical protein [Thalassotalea sp. ND16A]|uniref:hypothetical protein n=1 Tax=Thalassotalea sp. ND16A TaxID=1535422 RepID=UPI00051A61FF|nr:hypothetical protein [Thalassotalea sp. ND16A]KGJ95782.1 hypothetical protein ND16A_1317 [Thalassotalea sp. ND16A]